VNTADHAYVDYESDQSYISNSSEGEEYWDADVEEVLKDLETDDPPNSSVTDSFLHALLLFLNLWASFYGLSATALNHLIVFLHHVFSTMATKSLPTLATTFPTSLYMFQKHFGSNIDKFVICTKCGSLHYYFERILKLVDVQNYVIIFNIVIIPMSHTECLVAKNF